MYDAALLHGGATFSFLNYLGLVQFTLKSGWWGPLGILVKVTEELCESFFFLVKTMEFGIHREQSRVVGKYVRRSRGNALREYFSLDENE